MCRYTNIHNQQQQQEDEPFEEDIKGTSTDLHYSTFEVSLFKSKVAIMFLRNAKMNPTAVTPKKSDHKLLLDNSEEEKSINTVVVENIIDRSNIPTKEFTIRWQFSPKTERGNTQVATTHYELLMAMKRNFQEMKIFDNKGCEMKFKKSILSFREYSKHYELIYFKGNPEKNRRPQFSCFHHILTDSSINEIRNHEEINFILQKQNVKLNNHEWDEQSTRILNLGFFGGVDPSNYTRQQFKNDLRNKIAASTNRQPAKVPKFKCRYSSPFQYISDNDSIRDKRITTKAYNLEVRQRDAKEMIKLIQQTYKDNATFIFHRLRHTHPNIYSNAIRAQNKHLNSVRVIPIVGITKNEMFYLSNELLKIDGVTMVLEHPRTEIEGRFNVITDIQKFRDVTDIIASNLENTIIQIREKYSLSVNANFPPISVSFRSPNDDLSSTDTMQSYVSACSSLFSGIDTGDDNPPESTLVPIQAWNKPLSTQQTVSTYSSITTTNNGEKLQQMMEENKRLMNKVNELSQQVQILLTQKNASDHLAKPPKPPNGNKNNAVVDLRSIPQPSIDFLIDKVMERFQERTEDDIEMQETIIPNILDTSFDSELTPNPK